MLFAFAGRLRPLMREHPNGCLAADQAFAFHGSLIRPVRDDLFVNHVLDLVGIFVFALSGALVGYAGGSTWWAWPCWPR